jgi:hypothetical protein
MARTRRTIDPARSASPAMSPSASFSSPSAADVGQHAARRLARSWRSRSTAG